MEDEWAIRQGVTAVVNKNSFSINRAGRQLGWGGGWGRGGADFGFRFLYDCVLLTLETLCFLGVPAGLFVAGI